MRNWRAGVIGYSLFICFLNLAGAQPLPPCGDQRPTTILEPWSGPGGEWCPEEVIHNKALGGIGYTALAATNDTLYALAPQQGQLVQLTDTNNDALPDTPQLIMEGLQRPAGLTLHNGMLYVAAMSHIYRYDLDTSTTDTVTDTLPGAWTGYPNRGLLIDEGSVYVGVGGDVACTTGRGAVWRYPLSGGDGEIVAQGLRAPAALAQHHGVIYVADTSADAIWRLQAGSDYGACSTAPPPGPAFVFEAGAAPVALAAYTYETLPLITDRLLVALRGSTGQVVIPGYEVLALPLADDSPALQVLPRKSPGQSISYQRIQIQGSGFHPNHVNGLTVAPNGWVYVSVATGRILALRPIN